MTKLEEIKNQAAKDRHPDIVWRMLSPLTKELALIEVCERYAHECCKVTLEKAAENARTSGTHPVTIDKSSITNPDNICIL